MLTFLLCIKLCLNMTYLHLQNKIALYCQGMLTKQKYLQAHHQRTTVLLLVHR